MGKAETYNQMEEFFEVYNSTGLQLDKDARPTIIIAGAASGVGKALTEYFMVAPQGFRVIALDISKNAPEWFEEFDGGSNRGMGKGVFIYGEDCSDHERMHELFSWFQHEGLSRTEQPLHLIVTIGNNELSWVKDGPDESFSKVLNSNLLAPMVLASAFSYLIENGTHCPARKTITLFSSIAGEIPMRTTAPYCSAKAGVNMLVRCLARELINIAEVYGIILGPTDTSLMRHVAEQIAETRGKSIKQVWDEIKADLPVGELISIGDIVGTVAGIISGGRFSIFNSGTMFRITGGRS